MSVRSLVSRDVFPDCFGPTTTTLRLLQGIAEFFLRDKYRSNARGPHLTTTEGGSTRESPLRMRTVSCFSRSHSCVGSLRIWERRKGVNVGKEGEVNG